MGQWNNASNVNKLQTHIESMVKLPVWKHYCLVKTRICKWVCMLFERCRALKWTEIATPLADQFARTAHGH